jgi:hypothetical protein
VFVCLFVCACVRACVRVMGKEGASEANRKVASGEEREREAEGGEFQSEWDAKRGWVETREGGKDAESGAVIQNEEEKPGERQCVRQQGRAEGDQASKQCIRAYNTARHRPVLQDFDAASRLLSCARSATIRVPSVVGVAIDPLAGAAAVFEITLIFALQNHYTSTSTWIPMGEKPI